MSRKRGGGYGMGAPLVSIPSGPGGDWTFAVKEPINQGFDDCLFPARPGQLFNAPNPALAQAGWPLRGGRRTANLQVGGKIEESDIVVGKQVYVKIGDNINLYEITNVPEDGFVELTSLDNNSTIERSREELMSSSMVALQFQEIEAAEEAARASMPPAPPSLVLGAGPQLVHQNAMVPPGNSNETNTVVANINNNNQSSIKTLP